MTRNKPDYNFTIDAVGEVPALFRERGFTDFAGAAAYISRLPYRRNRDKTQPATVLAEHCGTCSTKHALLYALAAEHGRREVVLMLGIFKMKADSTPRISATLRRHGLDYIPEAHNYLRIHGEIADYTWPDAPDFSKDLLIEQEILPAQITDFKVDFHQAFLRSWLRENPAVPYTPEALWVIREQCIRDLAG